MLLKKKLNRGMKKGMKGISSTLSSLKTNKLTKQYGLFNF